MNWRLSLVLFGTLFLLKPLEAKTENGLSLVVQKITLDSEKDRNEFDDWDKVKKALGLRLEIKNTSFKDLPEGSLKYVVIVKKWGSEGDYERHSGEEKLPALLKSQSLKKVVGKIALTGYETMGSRRQYMDSIEAYRVTITHEGKQTIELTSSASFEALNKKATDAQ